MSQESQPSPSPGQATPPTVFAPRLDPDTLAYAPALSEQQFNRLIAVLERNTGLLGSLHALTPNQKAAIEAFVRTSVAMGITDFGAPPQRLVREGNVVAVEVPPGATRARVFLQTGVLELYIESAAPRLWLPEEISHTDRVARIEFLDSRGVVIAITGGQRAPNDDRFQSR